MQVGGPILTFRNRTSLKLTAQPCTFDGWSLKKEYYYREQPSWTIHTEGKTSGRPPTKTP